jgi:hypothetical protein
MDANEVTKDLKISEPGKVPQVERRMEKKQIPPLRPHGTPGKAGQAG